jgi:hypothetical protein
MIMKLMLWVLVLALALPALLVAIALGPVTVGVLCAIGFAAIVAAAVYMLGVGVAFIEQLGWRVRHR